MACGNQFDGCTMVKALGFAIVSKAVVHVAFGSEIEVTTIVAPGCQAVCQTELAMVFPCQARSAWAMQANVRSPHRGR